MTFGFTFVVIAALTSIFGSNVKPLPIPVWLAGNTDLGFTQYPTYRLFLIALGAVMALALWLLIDRTLYGARLRAAVDNPRMARAVGMDVNLLFTGTFAGGCALAGFGGVVGADMLPHRALLRAALSGDFPGRGLGRRHRQFQRLVRRRAGDRHYQHHVHVPAAERVGLYRLCAGVGAAAVAAARPAAGEVGAMTARPEISGPALAQLRVGGGRFGWAWHVLPWGIALATYFVAGAYLTLGTAALEMILFTLSIDLALGYAGIITFGQAAFFGVGAYAAGLLSIHLTPDPILGLLFGTGVGALLGLVTGMLILHTEGVTLMMLTLAIASMIGAFGEQAGDLTGGDNGLQGIKISPLFGLFPFDLWGSTAYLYALGVLFVWFVAAWRIVRSPFGRSLDGIRQSPRRMRAIGTPVWWRLVAVYTLAAAMAGTAGALKAQTNQFVGLDFARSARLRHRSGHADPRRHAAALWRVRRRRVLCRGAESRGRVRSVPLDVRHRRPPRRDRDVPRRRVDGPRRLAARHGRAVLARRRAQQMSDAAPALSVRGLSKSFGALAVAQSIDLDLEPGARLGLIGPNGAGKTSFVNLLTGMLRADSGTIVMNGDDITGLKPEARVRRGLARTHQINTLLTETSLRDNVAIAVAERDEFRLAVFALHAAMAALSWPRRRRNSPTLGIADLADRTVKELPYGQQRLLEIAIALVLKPRVLLLDEPAAGVPAAEAHAIHAALDKLPADIAILMIEHDMDLVFRFARRIAVLVQGRVLTTGTPREIAADPQVRAVYLGRSAA